MFRIIGRGLKRRFSQQSIYCPNGGYQFDPQKESEMGVGWGVCIISALKKADL